jgi:TRAP-type mannitol/chloroaromatic compound transport system substrate-binding protein
MNKTKILFPAVALTILGGSILGTRAIYAQDSTPVSSIVQKIATKFNLNEDEVQAVFDEERDARRADMEARYSDMLDEAVQKGYITESQKELILEKRAELDVERETHMKDFVNKRDLSDEERASIREEMQAHHEELQKWADENNIDLKYLMGFGMKFRGGFGGEKMMMFRSES